MPFYMISARATSDMTKTGVLKYMRSDDGEAYEALGGAAWVKEIVTHLQSDENDTTQEVLFFVHGYNVSQESAMLAHRIYSKQLEMAGWRGLLISFDWPSAGLTLAYLPDREEARKSANALVTGGIRLLQKAQTQDCTIAVNLLCHSLGAFVVQEAMGWAYQDVPPNWSVNQLLMVAPDIGAGGMAAGQKAAAYFEEHAGRVTVYSNRYDKALAVSNAKRLELAPRLGRIGLPSDTTSVMCGIDCSQLYDAVDPGLGLHLDPQKTHCFYFDQEVFWQDVVLSLGGGLDRNVISTRSPAGLDRFTLKTKPLKKADYELALARSDLNGDRSNRKA